MESRSKHIIKSHPTGKVATILHKTILVKLNRNLVHEINHLPYRVGTKFHEEVQDIHPLCKHALNCKLAVLCKHYCSDTKDERFLQACLKLGIPLHLSMDGGLASRSERVGEELSWR